MGAIDIRIGHDDDTVITQLVRIELFPPDTATESGDQGAHLLGGEHLVKTGLLNIENLALQRQDRLGTPIPALFGRATG